MIVNEMSDDYGQFVALDINNELESIDTFTINRSMKRYKIHNKSKIIKEEPNHYYWCIVGLCIIMLI